MTLLPQCRLRWRRWPATAAATPWASCPLTGWRWFAATLTAWSAAPVLASSLRRRLPGAAAGRGRQPAGLGARLPRRDAQDHRHEQAEPGHRRYRRHCCGQRSHDEAALLTAAASSGTLSVQIGAASDTNRDGVDQRERSRAASDPAHRTPTASGSDPPPGRYFTLYFSDDVDFADTAATLGELRDIIEVNGVPAVVLNAARSTGPAAPATTAGSMSRSDRRSRQATRSRSRRLATSWARQHRSAHHCTASDDSDGSCA